ncbi:DUF2024 family protein [Desertivirga brevis]|uniref:DUF2024 family protein n=1 Tax=Desertivirga brevis TaxID=2810310 RepID=UPI001A972FD7|nr:DUF2024 family protein [Pedobacter sp. SYSU D00873]
MKISVWDTYVQKKDGQTMHFDILVPSDITNDALIYEMGKQYLTTKGQEGQALSSKECQYCHQEIASEEMVDAIDKQGFYIIEMEGCN